MVRAGGGAVGTAGMHAIGRAVSFPGPRIVAFAAPGMLTGPIANHVECFVFFFFSSNPHAFLHATRRS